MSNIYKYLLPSSSNFGGRFRRYYQHKKLIVSLEFQSSDAVPMPPISLFDFTREIDSADASTISSTTTDGWTVSDDGVINGSSTSHAVLIRSTTCWQKHLQSINRTKTIPKKQQQASASSWQSILLQGENNSDEKFVLGDDENDSIEEEEVLLNRPYIRWYGNLSTQIGMESKGVQRSGFCAIRSPIFPFDGASLQGLYRFIEITCRYHRIPTSVVQPKVQQQSTSSSSSRSDFTENQQYQTDNNDTTATENTVDTTQSPSRIFILNLRVTSALNDDIYQGFLSLDPPPTNNNNNNIDTIQDDQSVDSSTGTSTTTATVDPPFRTFVIPFNELILTARGRAREYQRQLEGSVDIESIGFLLMDNINGPFYFDIATIRAVNCLDNGKVYESPLQIATTDHHPPSSFSISPYNNNNNNHWLKMGVDVI